MKSIALDSSIEVHDGSILKAHSRLGEDYQICTQTGLLYYFRAQRANSYEDDYFLSEYETQYGHSYLEDELYLRQLARRRLKKIKAHRPNVGSI